MKSNIKIILSSIAILLIFGILLVALGGVGNYVDTDQNRIDLSQENATTAYTITANMLNNPSDYLGKTIKIKGTHSATNKTIHKLTVTDSTGCCNASIEFVLKSNSYPPINSVITIEGIFESYIIDNTTHYRLNNATLV